MKCYYCGANTRMTVKLKTEILRSCCQTCYKEKNKAKPGSLSVSNIYKKKI